VVYILKAGTKGNVDRSATTASDAFRYKGVAISALIDVESAFDSIKADVEMRQI
jgi:hypothetical protein